MMKTKSSPRSTLAAAPPGRRQGVVPDAPPLAPPTAAPVTAPVVPPEPAVRVLRQFRQVFNAVKSHFQQMEKSAGVGGAQVWALSIIREQPGIGVNDVAQAMDVRQPTASNLVRSLAELGCIEVRKDAPDKRAVQLYLKAAGARVLRRAPGPFTGVLPDALAALPPATLQRFEEDLAQLLKALNADEQAARIPLGQM